ncbi:DUF1501 domain-containing protein [Alphaproteobacteria bacterium KMM 3653]|uniref:DUF1501 domain-containing protein n=1 Tax=Harenicola maris TaxID=2841044 RepID=A0AAP2CV05_9RHOB|nr:DUF1501 domain-containing protein [Harenicola maris]
MSMTSRRNFLLRGAAIGCSAAASPLLTPMTFAAAPWDARLVVIILRGGMDGIDVVQPYGDRDAAGLRPTLGMGEGAGASDLDGFFALHPGLSELMPLWKAGELGFAHAVSTPYRDKRSHFDGQDLLEAGTGFDVMAKEKRDGWLNRMLQTIPGIEAETAYAIGREDQLVLTGAAAVANWAPETRLNLSPQAERLLELVYHDDPIYREAIAEALDLTDSLEAAAQAQEEEEMDESMADMANMMQARGGNKAHLKLAEFAVNRLRHETRVASFSINGWDTHGGQAAGLKRALASLQDVILAMKAGLGPVWGKTTIIAMTEFGRTARENGTRGTDHGTGGTMVMAGGALRGGKVYGQWPGLAEADLYAGRDLMPTADVRAYAAATMRGLFGIEKSLLESSVFPGLDMAGVDRLIL